ncbi:hypothetical protein [Gilvimarinus polysaccharolyticus]|uniref:hypothetical protein n=1 Tax=Gilvimarinus polysaccharolyticus TaxID=863921 RepID=UPI000673C142|nr:hypothetical protein [Gilvimarinus polysaccharolyticus]
MTTSFFGQYLQLKGIVGRTQLHEAVTLQHNTNKTLAQITLAAGVLTPQQRQELPFSDCENDALFYQILSCLGWLSNAALAALHAQQRKAQLTLGEALVTCGYLNDKTLANLLTDYHYWNLRNLQQFSAQVSTSEFAHEVDAFSFILTQQMLKVYGLHVKPDCADRKVLTNTPAWHWQINLAEYCLNVFIPNVEGGVAHLLDRASLIDSLHLSELSCVSDTDLRGLPKSVSPVQFFTYLLQTLLLDIGGDELTLVGTANTALVGAAPFEQECLRCSYSLEGELFYVYFFAS